MALSVFADKEGRTSCLPGECYPSNQPCYAPVEKKYKTRVVPPFSLEANRQRNVTVKPFENQIVLKPYPVGNTVFRRLYLRGDFPISVEFDTAGPRIAWKESFDKLDYSFYLPMFFNGLCEIEYPYEFFAREGIREMIANGRKKVLPVIPSLILPIKNALNTRNRTVIATTLKIIQELVGCNETIGEALVPFYRQILSPLNVYRTYTVNIGDEIDYSQRRRENIGELVDETLRILETFGGKNAFINIKYMIPTYKSCVLN